MAVEPARRWRARFVALVVFAAFFLPVVLALVLNVTAPGWLPFGRTNQGTLIEPPESLRVSGIAETGAGDGASRAPDFADRWTLLVVTDGSCARACRESLERTRRVRLALGRDADRVARLLVVRGRAEVAPRHAPDLRIVAGARGWAPYPGAGAGVYVIDPQAYAVLRYPAPPEAPALLDDLERLLRISKLG